MSRQVNTVTSPSIESCIRPFRTHLEAGIKSPETIASYMKAVTLLQEYFELQGMPQSVGVISREHIESFLAELASRNSSATVINRFKGLRAFFKYLEEEGEVKDTPMRKVAWPKLEEKAVKACSKEEIKKLLGVCDRTTLKGRRDAALIGVMLDTGWRVNEVLRITVQAVVAGDRINVVGKGKKPLIARLSPQVQKLVDRYLRVRTSLRPELWISTWDRPMDRHAVWEMLERLSRQAGIEPVHPHALRHSHAIWWLDNGGNIMDLKENLGHSNLRTTEKYLRYQAKERAMEARKRFAPGNLL